MNSKTRDYYNNMLYRPWPSEICILLFMCIYIVLLILNKYIFLHKVIWLVSILIILNLFSESVTAWCGEECKKLRLALIFGFLLFLFSFSEAMLFGSVFWIYFDRLFNLYYVTGLHILISLANIYKWGLNIWLYNKVEVPTPVYYSLSSKKACFFYKTNWYKIKTSSNRYYSTEKKDYSNVKGHLEKIVFRDGDILITRRIPDSLELLNNRKATLMSAHTREKNIIFFSNWYIKYGNKWDNLNKLSNIYPTYTSISDVDMVYFYSKKHSVKLLLWDKIYIIKDLSKTLKLNDIISRVSLLLTSLTIILFSFIGTFFSVKFQIWNIYNRLYLLNLKYPKLKIIPFILFFRDFASSDLDLFEYSHFVSDIFLNKKVVYCEETTKKVLKVCYKTFRNQPTNIRKIKGESFPITGFKNNINVYFTDKKLNSDYYLKKSLIGFYKNKIHENNLYGSSVEYEGTIGPKSQSRYSSDFYSVEKDGIIETHEHKYQAALNKAKQSLINLRVFDDKHVAIASENYNEENYKGKLYGFSLNNPLSINNLFKHLSGIKDVDFDFEKPHNSISILYFSKLANIDYSNLSHSKFNLLMQIQKLIYVSDQISYKEILDELLIEEDADYLKFRGNSSLLNFDRTSKTYLYDLKSMNITSISEDFEFLDKIRTSGSLDKLATFLGDKDNKTISTEVLVGTSTIMEDKVSYIMEKDKRFVFKFVKAYCENNNKVMEETPVSNLIKKVR